MSRPIITEWNGVLFQRQLRAVLDYLEALVGTTSAGNSSTTPLSGGATFTGEWEQATGSDVMASVKTDAAGTMFFDFSTDGVNADSTFPPQGFQIAAGINEFHTATKGPRYFRIRVVNGSAAQSYMRLGVYYGDFKQGSLPIGAGIGADADARVVRSIPPNLDLALGRIGGQAEDSKFGVVANLDAADATADVWDWASDDLSGSPTKTFPTSAATLYIASDAAGDTSLEFTCDVILADGSLSQVTVTTDASDGTTPVSLGVSGLDCNRAELTGDGQSHSGNIYVQQGSAFTSGVPDTAGDVLAFIRATYGQTEQTHYTVPLGKTCRPKRASINVARSSGALGSAEMRFWVRKAGKSWVVKRNWFFATGEHEKVLTGIVLPARSQMRVDVESVSDTDTNISAEIDFDLVDE